MLSQLTRHRQIDREIAEGIACGDLDPVNKTPFVPPLPAPDNQPEETSTCLSEEPPAELAGTSVNDTDDAGDAASSSKPLPSTSFTLFAQYGTLRVCLQTFSA